MWEIPNMSSNEIHFGDVAAADGLSEFTVCARIRTGGVIGNGAVVVSKIITAGPNDGWELLFSGGTLALHTGDGNLVTGLGSTALSTSTAYTVGGRYDSGFNIALFLDGVDDTSGSPSNSAAIVANAQNLCIGNRSGAATSLGGWICDVVLWNVGLTDAEMLMFHNGMLPRGSSIVFFQPCNDKTQPDLVGGASPTQVGTITQRDTDLSPVPSMIDDAPPLSVDPIITYVYKVVDETLQFSESPISYYFKVVVVNDTLAVYDGNTAGGLGGLYDPWGVITDSVTDEGLTIVWTKGYPPFVRKTLWTDEVS